MRKNLIGFVSKVRQSFTSLFARFPGLGRFGGQLCRLNVVGQLPNLIVALGFGNLEVPLLVLSQAATILAWDVPKLMRRTSLGVAGGVEPPSHGAARGSVPQPSPLVCLSASVPITGRELTHRWQCRA